jgi:uncharacterized protein (DUF2236 family)
MLAAEMMRVPRGRIPMTVRELRAFLRDVESSGILRVTDAARTVASLFHDPPGEAEWRPILTGVSRLAFGTLPPCLRQLYEVKLTPTRFRAMRATFATMRAVRPLLPPRYRYIAPYQEWRLRRRGRAGTGQTERARRSAGIRLDRARSLRG